MVKKMLSKGEIKELVRYHENMEKRGGLSHTTSYFDKNQTIQILNAVTDKQTVTQDGKWDITYFNDRKPAGFFVKPVDGYAPCGWFEIESAITRLEL